MTENNGLVAELVYDGTNVIVPAQMGTPRSDQLCGTSAEILSELAGRVCYDSLGVGRPSFTIEGSEGYHDHIAKVGHGSVWEHFNFTVEIPLGSSRTLGNASHFLEARGALFAQCCANRPGVMVFPCINPSGLRLTSNLRAVVEWLRWERELYGCVSATAMQFASMLHRLGHSLAPHIVPEVPAFDGYVKATPGMASAVDFDELREARIVKPITDHERWISLYLSGSRGFSHEQVRHGDFTAISQRSTRFVDESESDWIQHPLISKYLDDVHADETVIPYAEDQVLIAARKAYQLTVQELEPYLLDQGVEKTSARKQARGAARGYLGNALQTEMIFSANIAQWKRMLRQRATVFADAEIRVVYCEALRELKASAYSSRFQNWQLQKSPDGIGQVAIETAD